MENTIQTIVTGMTKRGRKHLPHKTRDGRTIDGLYKKPNSNVWRVLATGQEFRCNDEVQAVAKFYRMTQPGKAQFELSFRDHQNNTVDRDQLAGYFRDQLLNNRVQFAAEVGIPQLANWQDIPLPKPSIKLAELIDLYVQHAEVKPRHIKKCIKCWKTFTESVNVETLMELTAQKFITWNDGLKAQGYAGPTIEQNIKCVRSVISFGIKRGLDAREVDGCLSVSKVIEMPESLVKDPKPISREDWDCLMAACNTDVEVAFLLLSMNCCLYCQDVTTMLWSELNLDKGLYQTRRGKTGVVRAATLWNRTVEVLKKLPKTGKHVFTSPNGSAYHVETIRCWFKDIRTAAGLNVEHNQIRDGAYTVAASTGNMTASLLLAGHKLQGEADHYVQRNPGMVRQACEAVEFSYFADVQPMKMIA